ncbi:MAG: YcaO-like family protein [Thermaurantiacus tibetensis]|uniref:YcaO-like family protein n=1 Tax=Thermaurantiacus tibetensis TaxID=2759035 RepID=UPI00188E497B|nr:YcaO-like family protein [Thermaurantiacus tibetensis]
MGGKVPAALPLQWVEAKALAGASFRVPLAQVRMDFTGAHPLTVSSNGNASGETRAGALLAGLLEVIARAAIAAWLGQDPLARGLAALAPDGHADAAVRTLLARARDAGIGVRFHALPSAAGVPVVACQLLELRPDRVAGRVAVGTAARPTLAGAIRNSLAKAAQVRRTRIAGAREDLPTPAAEDADNGFGAHLPCRRGWPARVSPARGSGSATAPTRWPGRSRGSWRPDLRMSAMWTCAFPAARWQW